MNTPEVGATYRHYKGGLYAVIANAINEPTKSEVVVYRAKSDGTVWVRPLWRWNEEARVRVEVPPNTGKYKYESVQRFVRVE